MTYADRKEKARQQAVEWQMQAGEESLSYMELIEAQAHFEALAKRYGLTREFRENGIL